jgi:hypothetical protein
VEETDHSLIKKLFLLLQLSKFCTRTSAGTTISSAALVIIITSVLTLSCRSTLLNFNQLARSGYLHTVTQTHYLLGNESKSASLTNIRILVGHIIGGKRGQLAFLFQ